MYDGLLIEDLLAQVVKAEARSTELERVAGRLADGCAECGIRLAHHDCAKCGKRICNPCSIVSAAVRGYFCSTECRQGKEFEAVAGQGAA
ncbi:MAG TPA: hypothetical protein VKY85_01380 [Candidatus Angelobacter sp.]|nr:hypothetical protein [Candidatus Angelobacter sp.]